MNKKTRIGSSLGKKLAGLVLFSFLLVGSAQAAFIFNNVGDYQWDLGPAVSGNPLAISFEATLAQDFNMHFNFGILATGSSDSGVNNTTVGIGTSSGSTDIFLAQLTGPQDFADYYGLLQAGTYYISLITPLGGMPANGAWSINGTASAVPVPAALWLFGSAIIGFIGFSRRRASTSPA